MNKLSFAINYLFIIQISSPIQQYNINQFLDILKMSQYPELIKRRKKNYCNLFLFSLIFESLESKTD
jgi:hypothetical protein